jgi:hypothetical protein
MRSRAVSFPNTCCRRLAAGLGPATPRLNPEDAEPFGIPVQLSALTLQAFDTSGIGTPGIDKAATD